jgi:hypothetical protein
MTEISTKYYKILSFDDLNYFIQTENIVNKNAFKEKEIVDKIKIIFQIYGFVIIKKDSNNFWYYHSGNNYKDIDQGLIEVYKRFSKSLITINKIEDLLNTLENAIK